VFKKNKDRTRDEKGAREIGQSFDGFPEKELTLDPPALIAQPNIIIQALTNAAA